LIAAAGLTAAVCVAATLLAIGTVLLADSRWLKLPRITPWLIWFAIIALVGTAVYFMRRRYARVSTPLGVARAVERERALRDGSVRTALEVGEASSLGRLGAAIVAARLEGFESHVLVPGLRRSLRRVALVGAGLVLVAVSVLTLAAARSSDGWAAVVHPVKAWRGTLLGNLAIDDAPAYVERGDLVTLKVRAPGREGVTVVQRATGASWRESALPMEQGAAALRIGPVDADVAVAVTDGRAWSDTVHIRVADRPFLGDVSIRAIFPAYLDRREEALPTGEPARIPRGTVLVLDGTSSTELTSVKLVGDGSAIELTPNGRRFSGRMTAMSSVRLTWDAVGKSGKIADVPDALELDVLPDSNPTIEILAPGRDTVATEDDSVGVAILATDDHGLANVALRVTVLSAAGDEGETNVRQLFSQRSQQWSGETMLSTRGISPGTTLRLVAVATDASPWKQTTMSREVLVRVPTLSEMRDAVRAIADSTVAKANSATNAQKALEKRTADAARRQQRQQQAKENLSYENAEQAKNVAKDQREIADRVEQLQRTARELERQLRQAGALDSGLAARLRETQELLKQALTPELAEQLRKLEESAQQLSGEQAQKSLQDLAEQQRKLREQLEKSAEMLKRAAIEGQMSTLKEEAKELAEKQRQMAEQLGKQPQSNAEKQARDLAKQSRELAEDVKNLEQRLAQAKAEAGKERVSEATDKINEAARAMERAAQQQQGQQQEGQQQQGQPQQGQQSQQGQQRQGQAPPNAAGQSSQQGQQSSSQAKGEQGKQQGGNAQQGGQEAAKEAAEAMAQAADQLAKAREQQIGEWKSELTTELDRAIQEMLQLAREQRSLEQQAREGKAPNELRSQQSALQQGVAKASERLEEEGRKSSLLSQRSVRAVQDASKKVEDATQRTQAAQSGQQMATAMRDAGDALNQAAASLVRDRERAGEAKSASGFQEMLEQLQQLARQQQSLNQSMMDLLPRMGDQGGKQQSRQLARQQREVAAGLEEAADRDNTGRAEAMAREARQLAQALESASVDPSVLERQQRLFRKMLDAGLSLEKEDEREDQGKREAKPWTGTEVYNPGTTAVSGKAASKFQSPTWNDLRGLTPEERRLVLEYFKRLNAEKQP
jgi:hypothetical protein